jgi:archaellum component FlaC
MLRPLSRRIRLLVFFTALVVSVVIAQSIPTLETFVATDSDKLDIAAIAQAAQALADKGIKPVVLFVEGDVGQSLDEASSYFDRALESYGLRQADGSLQKNLFALFVGTNPLPESDDQRPIFILYENELFPILSSMAGSKDVDAFIREDLMIPKLLDGNFTGAFTSVFESLEERLPTGQAETAEPGVGEPEIILPEPEVTAPPNFLQPFWWLGIPVVALLAFLGLRRRARNAPAGVTQDNEAPPPVLDDAGKLKVIKAQLATLMSSLEPSLPNDPNNQTEMVLMTGFLEGQHPEELAQLNQDYAKAVQQLKTVSANLSTYTQTGTASEQLPRYQALLAEANEVKAFTQSLSDRWQRLNRELASIPDKLSAMRGSLQQLRASYKERPDFVSADEVFKPLEDDISEVEGVHQANKSLESLRMLSGVQDNIALVSDSITRLMDADQQLDTFEANLPNFQTQGFKLYRFAERIPEVRQSMEIALRLIKQGEYKVLDAQVDAVVEQTGEVVNGAKTFTELHKTNSERLEELDKLSEELAQHLDKSAAAFTAFKEFSPTSWRDVQGNGTEAQNALNRAQELWEQAQEDNDMAGPQEFDRAKTNLEGVSAELEQAKKLLEAVDTRLQDLQTAKATAKDQLALVEKDIAEFQTTLRGPEVDRNVGQAPELKLSQAKTFLDKARAELSQSLPDWLVIMQSVQSADKIADEALNLMRSEQEAMERRQVRLNSEKIEAQTSLQRLLNYVQVHHGEISQTTAAQAEQLNLQFQQAEAKEQSAKGLSEERLGQTLEQVATLFDGVQQQADVLFTQAEKDFSSLETLRKQVAERLTALQSRINGLNSQLINAGVTPSPIQRQLYVVSNGLPVLTNTDRTSLENALATLNGLEQTLGEIASDATREINTVQTERVRRAEEQNYESNNRDSYSWGGFGVPSPPRQSSPWWGSSNSSNSSSRSSGSSWSSRSSSSSSSSRSSSSSSRSSSSSSRSSSWGGSGKKSGGGW